MKRFAFLVSGLWLVSAAVFGSAGIPRSESLPVQIRPDRPALERDLAQARARWTAGKPASYEFVLNVPTAGSPWNRRFASVRVTAGSSATITPLTGSMAPLFQDRTTIDALFDLVAERIAASSASVSVYYDDQLGYVTDLLSLNYKEVAFEIPVWRAFIEAADVREPFVLVHHVNHCGFVQSDPRSLSQCPSYSVAMWGDGTVVYLGRAGVRTLGRRQHQADLDAVRDLSRAIADSGFFAMTDEYRSVRPRSDGLVDVTDHAAEKWVTVRVDGRQKTVHDFVGAPEALKRLEAAIEAATNSQRYTGRSDTGRENHLNYSPRTPARARR